MTAVLVVVGFLGGCGSDEKSDHGTGTGANATLHGYCAAVHRMNRDFGSLGKVRAGLKDKAATDRGLAAMADVRDHAPGEIRATWQDVIDAYKELAVVVRSNRRALVDQAVAKALREQPPGASRLQKLTAAGKAGYAALRKDEKADAPHQARATRLLDAVPDALGSVKGSCQVDWRTG